MDNSKNKPGFFLPSGCLSAEGMRLIIENEVPGEKMDLVAAHLSSCEFCATALEGFERLVAQGGQPSLATEELNDKIGKRVAGMSKKEDRGYFRRPVAWIAMAASIVLLAGLFWLLKNKPGKLTEEIATVEPSLSQINAPPPPQMSEKHDSALLILTEHEQPTKVGGITKNAFTPPLAVADSITEQDNMPLIQEDFVATDSRDDAGKESVVQDNAAVIKSVREEGVKTEEKQELSAIEVITKSGKSKRKAAKQGAPSTGKTEQRSAEDYKSTPVFTYVEEMPGFPGGQDSLSAYLERNIRYPEKAKENAISGTVYVSFVVGNDGSIREVKLLRGIGGRCDEETLRVVSNMPKWNPGRQQGKAVSVQYTLPVKFVAH